MQSWHGVHASFAAGRNAALDPLAVAVFRWREKGMRKVISDIIAYCNTFRLFVVIVVLP